MKDKYLEHNFDPTERINYYIEKYPKKKILFEIKEFPKIDKYHFNDYEEIVKNLKQNSNLNKNILDKNKINIVLHIRYTRDSKPRREILKGYLKNNYKIFLQKIAEKFKDRDIQIYFISDTNKDNFKEFKFINNNTAKLKNSKYIALNNIKFLLKTDSMECFNIMANADILVMFASAFSYCAGIFNENFVIYPEFHDKPFKDWFIYNNTDFNNLNLSDII